MVDTHTDKSLRLLSTFICLALSSLPLFGVLAPRLLAFLPALIGLGSCIAYRISVGAWPSAPKGLTVATVLGIGLMGASYFWAYAPETVTDRMVKTAPVLIGIPVFAMVLNALPVQYLEKIKAFFPVAVLLAGAILVVDLYSFGGIYKAHHTIFKPEAIPEFVNLSGLNRSAIIFVLSALVAIFMRVSDIKKSRKSRVHTLSLCSLIILVFLGTDSQSAQLGLLTAILAFALGVLVLRARVIFWRLLQGALFALTLSAPWLVQWAFKSFAEMLKIHPWLSQGYAANRLEIWDYIARRALEKPWIGHGVEATKAIKDFDSPLIYTPINYVLHPHNFAIQLWIELGVLGAVCGGLILVAITELIRRQSDFIIRYGALSIFLAVLCIGSTGFGLWQGWWLGFITYMMAVFIVFKRIRKH